MTNTKDILSNRLSKLERQFSALKDYYLLIKKWDKEKHIYSIKIFNELKVEERAVFDAYLKRFSSVQDYLGTKIFPVLVELTGSKISKMSEILLQMEKEEIIESLESWISLRELRNNLEHEYPNELESALKDLAECVEKYSVLENCKNKVILFVNKIYTDFEYETY